MLATIMKGKSTWMDGSCDGFDNPRFADRIYMNQVTLDQVCEYFNHGLSVRPDTSLFGMDVCVNNLLPHGLAGFYDKDVLIGIEYLYTDSVLVNWQDVYEWATIDAVLGKT